MRMDKIRGKAQIPETKKRVRRREDAGVAFKQKLALQHWLKDSHELESRILDCCDLCARGLQPDWKYTETSWLTVVDLHTQYLDVEI